MTGDYTREEAINRYGTLMMDYGRLQEQSKIVEALGIDAEFSVAQDILGQLKTYRELTREHFPDIFEWTNIGLNGLEMLCDRLIAARGQNKL